MNRRDFVGTLLVLPVGVFLVHCSSSDSNSPAAPPRLSGSQVVYTSSDNESHHHTFGIELTAFANPPSAGVSGVTSNDEGHTHTVSVSAADLGSVQKGGSVMVTTSSDSGHTHVFTFVKVSS